MARKCLKRIGHGVVKSAEKPKFQVGQIIYPMINDVAHLPHVAGRVTVVSGGQFWVKWLAPDAYMPKGPYDLRTGAYGYRLRPQK